MKKFIAFFISIILVASIPFGVYAQTDEASKNDQLSYEVGIEQLYLSEESAIEQLMATKANTFDKKLLEYVKNALVSGAAKIDITAYSVHKSKIGDLFLAVEETYPLECCVSRYRFYGQYYYYTNSGFVTTVAINYWNMDNTTYQERYNVVTNTINEICADLDETSTDFEKALAVHDYLVFNYKYDETYTIYDAYNMIAKKTGVCQAYSEVFDLLMAYLDVECVIVSSSDMNHAWNLVKIEGSWYHMDATWDDPVPDKEGRIKYTYFLHDDASFKEDYEHYGWNGNGIVASNEEYEDLPRGNNATQVYSNDYWYYVQNNQLWRCDYNGNNPKKLLDGVACVAAYNERLFLGMGKNIVKYDPATGKQETIYTMVDEESGDWPTNSKVGVNAISISSDGLLTYTCYVWKYSGNNLYTSATVNGVNTLFVKDPPKAVANITAVATGSNSIRISWNASKGADGYELYRSASSNGSYTRIYKGTNCSYIDSALSPLTTYYYKVIAYANANGNNVLYSDASKVVNAKTVMAYRRIAGTSRVGTAIEVSKQGWSQGADTVLLTNGYSFADALAGGPLAYALDAPILLTANSSKLEQDVISQIKTLGAKKVIILGGEIAVNENIERQLVALGYKVERVAGTTRFETAVEIAKRLEVETGVKAKQVFFADSHNYPDALAVSPIASVTSTPILFVRSSGVFDGATIDYLQQSGVSKVTILGGNVAISTAAESNLSAKGISSNRIYGSTRYETSLLINQTYQHLFDGKSVVLATGQAFPDALAGGAFSAKLDVPIVLINPLKVLDNICGFIDGRDPQTVYILGGTTALSDEIVAGYLK